jgi:hypothetical protein
MLGARSSRLLWRLNVYVPEEQGEPPDFVVDCFAVPVASLRGQAVGFGLHYWHGE